MVRRGAARRGAGALVWIVLWHCAAGAFFSRRRWPCAAPLHPPRTLGAANSIYFYCGEKKVDENDRPEKCSNYCSAPQLFSVECSEVCREIGRFVKFGLPKLPRGKILGVGP